MTVTELIVARKKDIGRKGLKPGRSKVYYHGHTEEGRRRFTIVIPAEPGHIMSVTGTCEFDESDVYGTESNLIER